MLTLCCQRPKQAQNKWVITDEQKTLYDLEFVRLDKDLDGLVTGIDVKDTLLQSGLPQPVLAHIWYVLVVVVVVDFTKF